RRSPDGDEKNRVTRARLRDALRILGCEPGARIRAILLRPAALGDKSPSLQHRAHIVRFVQKDRLVQDPANRCPSESRTPQLQSDCTATLPRRISRHWSVRYSSRPAVQYARKIDVAARSTS